MRFSMITKLPLGGGSATLTVLVTVTVASLLLLGHMTSSTIAFNDVNVRCTGVASCNNENNIDVAASSSMSAGSGKYHVTKEQMREMYMELFKQKILDALRHSTVGNDSSYNYRNGGSHGYRSSSTVFVNRTVVVPAAEDAPPDPHHPLYNPASLVNGVERGGAGVGGGEGDRGVGMLPASERYIQNKTAFAWSQWHRPSKESVSVVHRNNEVGQGQGHDRRPSPAAIGLSTTTARSSPKPTVSTTISTHDVTTQPTTKTTSSSEHRHGNHNNVSVKIAPQPRRAQVVVPLSRSSAKKRKKKKGRKMASSRSSKKGSPRSRSVQQDEQGLNEDNARYISNMRFRLNIDHSSIGRLQLLVPIRYKRPTLTPDLDLDLAGEGDTNKPRRRWRRSRRRTIHLTISLRRRGYKSPRYVTLTSLRTTLRHSKWLSVPLPASVVQQQRHDRWLTLRLACDGCSADLRPLTAALSTRRTVTGVYVSTPSALSHGHPDSLLDADVSHGERNSRVDDSSDIIADYTDVTDDTDNGMSSESDTAAHWRRRRRTRKHLMTSSLDSDRRKWGREKPSPYLIVKIKD